MKNFEKAIDRVIAKLFECTEELKQCNEEIEKLQTNILDKEWNQIKNTPLKNLGYKGE